MKNLTIVLFAIILFSCGNKKAEIVEQIKLYKDSSRTVSVNMAKITADETLKYEELFYSNGRMDNKKYNDANRKAYEVYQEKNRDEQYQLKWKQSVYQNKIDSLELELKKY